MTHTTSSLDVHRRWWVLGASGLTGKALVNEVLRAPGCKGDCVEAWIRRPGAVGLSHECLTETVVDWSKPVNWPAVQADVAVSCLGTTIKTAGSKEAFKAVDLDLVVNMARHAKAHGVKHFVVISALGASSQSPVFYNRIKGQMQDALAGMGFESLSILQPSLLDGDRQEYRLGEHVGLVAMRLLKPLLPLNVRAIHADTIARAIVNLVTQPKADVQAGVRVVSSGQMQTLGKVS